LVLVHPAAKPATAEPTLIHSAESSQATAEPTDPSSESSAAADPT
jgi:hypothetical protein